MESVVESHILTSSDKLNVLKPKRKYSLIFLGVFFKRIEINLVRRFSRHFRKFYRNTKR